MWDKLKNSDNMRDFLMKAVTIIIVIAIIFLSVDVFTQSRDGRRQIIDEDGGVETSLEAMLSDIKGAGEVSVLIQEDSKGDVTGVIVTATGAGSKVVKNNLSNAVAAVFNIPTSNVMVFEKENGGNSND